MADRRDALARARGLVARHAPPRVAILGCGFTGAAAAIALVEAARGPLAITIVDRDRSRGGGLAFGRAPAGELLKVRARDLSILSGRPGDFAGWMACLTGAETDPAERAAIADGFAPRALFANYVRRRLDEAAAARDEVSLERLEREALDIAPAPGGGYAVALDQGPALQAQAVILATGYDAPRPRFGRCPHAPIPAQALARARRVALVGSGLTMVDVLPRLRAEGCEAEVTVISRRGLVPRPHAETAVRPPALQVPAGARLAELVRDLRAACGRAEAEGRPWQGEVNRLRPHAQAIWQALSEADRARFLRHLRPFWDAHRHRLPPAQHARLAAELARPRTRLRPGRVLEAVGEAPCRLRVVWRGARTPETLGVDIAIDCSGHRPELAAPLPASLAAQGLAAPDPSGLGLRVAADGRLWSPRGGDLSGLFALGPLGQGSLFEITAVPEIVRQAAQAAATLGDLLAMPGRMTGRAAV
ncbi:FAD/NAD(P)-binding protein [Albimonas sp. CAU 1670]|uniref:FAD/NAD(P)-binding protein n=1 Tax=Albimonas sp. CAU 1670 TaxID=3032599 RepID=UPI0023DAA194|nr:FAD/NAD(P)-binding protein [Albimonas sp. CAU 1670]MDF2233796.1 FAD/NAD(P)-binding protein [Albimonas sp. CAU 1670]